MVLLFPLLWDVKSIHDIRARIRFILDGPRNWPCPCCFLCCPAGADVLLVQPHRQADQCITAMEPNAFFNDPQIINFLFKLSQRLAGLYAYHVIRSCWLLWFHIGVRGSFLVQCNFILRLHGVCSQFPGGSGRTAGPSVARALVESYSSFCVSFCCRGAWGWYVRQAVLKYTCVASCSLFYLLVQVNIIQSLQCKYGILHWNGMNKQVYWYIF